MRICQTNRAVAASLSLAFALFAHSAATAGPLNPPAGAIASTAKPLSEVEPRTVINATNTPGDADSLFKITQPGSYYLTGNITGVVGKHGIEIAASGVTIDLNGFDLVGVPAMGAFDGVNATLLNARSIAVVNGSVREWGDDGIDLGISTTNNNRVERVLASGNGGGGIVAGRSCIVVSCAAYQNAGNGISTGDFSALSGCVASLNTGLGVSTGGGSTVTNCTAYNNGSNGISTNLGCTVSSCTAYDNAGSGIDTSSGCTVSNCTAYSNSGAGINTGTGGTVEGCTSRSNTLDGIACSSSCVIRGNTCSISGNGAGDGAGIHATGIDNRIEANSCTGADRGIDVDGAGNIIIKNTCTGNSSNWEIAIGNSVGPIVVAGTNGAAISGNGPAASTLGSTDPRANYSY